MRISLSPRIAILMLAGLTTLPVLASEGGGGSSLIQPRLGTIVWTIVTFLALVFVLGRYAWKPLLGALDAREKSIHDSIDQARRDREQAESLLEQQRDLLAEAHRERAAALSQGQREAERLRSEILEEARKQREQLLQQTEQQVQAGMRQARTELRSFAADLAIRAAEKLLTKNLDDGTQRRLVEEYLDDLEDTAGPRTPPS